MFSGYVSVIAALSMLSHKFAYAQHGTEHGLFRATATTITETSDQNQTRKLDLDLELQLAEEITNREGRIVGGTYADRGEFPSYIKWAPIGCGGTLIHEDIVLSAAHCYDPESNHDNDKAWIGWYDIFDEPFSDIPERKIETIVQHPLFGPPYAKYDFGVLKLKSPIYGVELTTLNTARDVPGTGDVLTVIGFGSTSSVGGPGSGRLKKADVNFVPYPMCSAVHGAHAINDDIVLCAIGPGRDSCNGDSGGPIFASNGDQVGIVSWGSGCGNENVPGMYSRVSYAYPWIQNQICSLSSNPPSHCVSITFSFECGHSPEQITWAVSGGGELDGDDDNNFQPMIQSTLDACSQRNSFYETSTKLAPGNYRFSIDDSGENGWFGGKYSIWTGTELLTANDNEFGASRMFDFTILGDGSVEPTNAASGGSIATQATPAPTRRPTQRPTRRPTPMPTPMPVPALAGDEEEVDIVIELHFDKYPEEVGWYIMDVSNNNRIWEIERGHYPWFEYRSRTIQEFVTVRKGVSYQFVITDSGEDGICCAYGYGRYKVTAAETGNVLVDGNPSFGSSEETNFMIN